MNSQKFDLSEAATSTPNSNFVPGNPVTNNVSYIYQQTPRSTQHMSSLHNTTDEYHTANEESFKVTANNSMNSSIIQQNPNTPSSNLSGGQAIMTTPTSTTGPTTMAARKQMIPADMSEPTKPLSAYALFFRDTVSAIKQQNPSCSFPELSKIVSSMWDALDSMHKGVYIKKNELARTEYLKQLKNYQQQLQQKQTQLNASNNEVQTSNINDQQQQLTQQSTLPVPQNVEQINNNIPPATTTTAVPNVSSTSAPPPDDAIRLPESSLVQKCTRENCNKRAIISPDWEDEYCSNECVIMHCRNVFNVWVQSNLEAKQQDQLKQPAPAI